MQPPLIQVSPHPLLPQIPLHIPRIILLEGSMMKNRETQSEITLLLSHKP